jgi:hypothetical protein
MVDWRETGRNSSTRWRVGDESVKVRGQKYKSAYSHGVSGESAR